MTERTSTHHSATANGLAFSTIFAVMRLH